MHKASFKLKECPRIKTKCITNILFLRLNTVITCLYINMHMVKVYGTSLPEKLTNEDQCERFIRALSNGQFIPPQKNRECYDSGK